jgi:predicted nucleotidyltransferase
MPVESPPQSRIPLPLGEIDALCRKWQIRELSLFGSALRDDFNPDSDIDLLVTFEPEAHWSLFDFIDLQDELARLFQRRVEWSANGACGILIAGGRSWDTTGRMQPDQRMPPTWTCWTLPQRGPIHPGKTWDDFAQDPMLRYAVERAVEIIERQPID